MIHTLSVYGGGGPIFVGVVEVMFVFTSGDYDTEKRRTFIRRYQGD
jgi:hypothetical protein